jgi:hypothetical protein
VIRPTVSRDRARWLPERHCSSLERPELRCRPCSEAGVSMMLPQWQTREKSAERAC